MFLKAIDSDVSIPNELEVDSVKAKHVSINGSDVTDLLAERERKFTAGTPFLRPLSDAGDVVLTIDETANVLAGSFQSGKFRMRATALSLNIERFDDEGDTVTDSWQRIAAFNWGDTSGSIVKNSIRADGQAFVSPA